VARQVQHAVQQRAGVAVGQNEAVTVQLQAMVLCAGSGARSD
jgi:hypothetical protein